MRTLILGGTGLLGPYLRDSFTLDGAVAAVGSKTLDASNPEEVAAMVAAYRPDTVINCVACTDVDLCERDPVRADMLNRAPVAALAATLSPETVLVQISTDQVYPGNGSPFQEDAVGPINEYGRTKLAAEEIAEGHRNSLILRVNLFGPSRTVGRKSLSDWLTENLRKGTPITLFTDSFFSPLRMATLAETTRRLVAHGVQGTFNLGSRDGASKAWFARRLAAAMNLSLETASEGTSATISGRAPRPLDMRMDVSKLEAAAGIQLPTLAREIDEHAAEERRVGQ